MISNTWISIRFHSRSKTSYRSCIKITLDTYFVHVAGIAGRLVLLLRREIVSLRFMTVREARSKVLTRNFRGELYMQVTMGGRCDYNGLDRFYDDDHYRRDCYTVGNDVDKNEIVESVRRQALRSWRSLLFVDVACSNFGSTIVLWTKVTDEFYQWIFRLNTFSKSYLIFGVL